MPKRQKLSTREKHLRRLKNADEQELERLAERADFLGELAGKKLKRLQQRRLNEHRSTDSR